MPDTVTIRDHHRVRLSVLEFKILIHSFMCVVMSGIEAEEVMLASESITSQAAEVMSVQSELNHTTGE